MTPRKQRATVTNDIPDDILLTNIFIRLSSKQLSQMRSLSKPWNNLLSAQSFVKSHLYYSAHNKDETLLVFKGGSSFKDVEAFTPHPTSRTPQLTDFIKRLLVKPLSEDRGCKIIGSVNGLICLDYGYFSYTNSIYIWNPSLSAILCLPPYSMPSSCGYHVYFRFGFDPKTDDYKVVKLTADIPLATGHYIRRDKLWKQVEVYSMRKHSWKFIKSFPPRCKDVIDRNEVCVDGHYGHLHWLAYDVEEGVELIKRQKIVALDLGTETFNTISLPYSLQIHNYKRPTVLDFMTGKLCVMSQVKDSEFEVWAMDEYGVAESWWLKHRVFSHQCGIHRPLGFTLNNELVYIDNDECIALYNPIAYKVNSSKIKVSMKNRNKIVQYVDSLVWVVDAKHCIRKKPRRPKKGFRTWFT